MGENQLRLAHLLAVLELEGLQLHLVVALAEESRVVVTREEDLVARMLQSAQKEKEDPKEGLEEKREMIQLKAEQ